MTWTTTFAPQKSANIGILEWVWNAGELDEFRYGGSVNLGFLDDARALLEKAKALQAEASQASVEDAKIREILDALEAEANK